MKHRNCLCLNCSRISSVVFSGEKELERTDCPQCGARKLVLLPEEVFSSGT